MFVRVTDVLQRLMNSCPPVQPLCTTEWSIPYLLGYGVMLVGVDGLIGLSKEITCWGAPHHLAPYWGGAILGCMLGRASTWFFFAYVACPSLGMYIIRQTPTGPIFRFVYMDSPSSWAKSFCFYALEWLPPPPTFWGAGSTQYEILPFLKGVLLDTLCHL